jgi:tetratricopeptide (TPR) repeat protein
LWLFITGRQANRQRESGNLDHAKRSYQRILAMLEVQPQSDGTRTSISVAASHLGLIAIMNGRLDEAEHWYHQSLAIDEDLGDRPGMAIIYHQLGNIDWSRGELDEAEGW